MTNILGKRLSGHKYHDHVLMFWDQQQTKNNQVDSDANNNVMC